MVWVFFNFKGVPSGPLLKVLLQTLLRSLYFLL